MTAIVWISLPLDMLVAGYLLETFGLRATLVAEAVAFVVLGVSVLLNPALGDMRSSAEE